MREVESAQLGEERRGDASRSWRDTQKRRQTSVKSAHREKAILTDGHQLTTPTYAMSLYIMSMSQTYSSMLAC